MACESFLGPKFPQRLFLINGFLIKKTCISFVVNKPMLIQASTEDHLHPRPPLRLHQLACNVQRLPPKSLTVRLPEHLLGSIVRHVGVALPLAVGSLGVQGGRGGVCHLCCNCHAIKLSSCPAIKLSSCQAVKLSSCHAVKLSSPKVV